MERIYLDHAATTALDPRVAKAMNDFELEFFGNPSSTHREGQGSRAKIDFARAQIAKFLNARPQEIIFTSGATEANNLAIQGVVNHYLQNKKTKPHVVTTFLEHQSVFNTVKELEKRGVVEATFVKPMGGLIRPEDVTRSLQKNTVLVSTIFASNEVGSITNVREIARKLPGHIAYHVDAVQAVKFLNCNVEKLGCHLLTVSSHKIYGPKGVGALYVKKGLKMANLAFGGSQEYGLRPGTQNTSGIIGFARAIQLLGSLEERQAEGIRLAILQGKLIKELNQLPGAELNGHPYERIPDNISYTFNGVDQDALMTALDLAGIAASTGSACVSGSSEPSHVIKSLGKLTKGDSATLRLTLGRTTKTPEVDYTIKTISNIIKKLRHEK